MCLRARRRGRWHCNVEIKCKYALFSPFLVKRRDISPSERPQAPSPFSGKKPCMHFVRYLDVLPSTVVFHFH